MADKKPQKITLNPQGFKAFAQPMGSTPAEAEKPSSTKPTKIVKRKRR